MKKLAMFFKAFSEELRLRIFAMLAAGREACVCELSGILKTTQSKTSRHLAYLKKSGLVSSRRFGTCVYYMIARKTDLERPEFLESIKKGLMKNRLVRSDLKKLAGLGFRTEKAGVRSPRAKSYD